MRAAMFPLGLAVHESPQGIFSSNSNEPNPRTDIGDDSKDVATFNHAVGEVNAPLSHYCVGATHQDVGGSQSLDVNINASIAPTVEPVSMPHISEIDIVSLVNYDNTDLPVTSQELNPQAATFQARDPNLVHRGRIFPDLNNDWAHIQ